MNQGFFLNKEMFSRGRFFATTGRNTMHNQPCIISLHRHIQTIGNQQRSLSSTNQ
jgi:primase-polymerase (primpol)-like protein